MTNENHQNTDEEIRELEGRLKTLKQQSRGDKGNPYMIPAAVLIAGALIAGAVFYSNRNSSNTQAEPVVDNVVQPQPAPPPILSGNADNIKPVSAEDHIRGNPDALVKFVEFSDLECPFCKRLHPTLQQMMDEYGDNSQVAWVYRHFPLDALHSKARKEAEATECANELGGNDGFWAYMDKLFEITPANNGLDLTLLPQIAEDVGLDRAKFEVCLNSGKYAQHIESDYQDAVASGGQGTPYNVIIAPNGDTYPLNGAVPLSSITSIIDLALKGN